MIPNKLAYFSQGSTYRTYKEEEDVSENTISFVGDDLSVATQGKIFGVRGVYPGVCITAGGTAAKTATTTPLFPLDSSGKPLPGTTIAIKFSNTNSYKTSGTTMTLNVNSTGAYPIYYNNAEVVSTTSANTIACGYKNRYTYYIFNGTQWVWLSYGIDSNSTYSNASLGQGYAVQDNNAESDTITATLSSYALTTGGIVVVKFIFDVPCVSNPTLNINDKGAKAIYHNGSPLGPGIIKSGDLATFIYSTNYYLISIDRDFSEDTTVGTLNTDNSTAQTASSSESFSGNISLHKISKTGSYNDLLNKPNIPTIPTNVSAFTNDVGYLTSYTETDPNVPDWAKAENKPSYTASEISGLATVATSGSYNDLSNKPTIPSIGTLNTNNSTDQTANSSESFSGNINLHKVSKTGSYNDLLNKPTNIVHGISVPGQTKTPNSEGIISLVDELNAKESSQKTVIAMWINNSAVSFTNIFQSETYTHSEVKSVLDNPVKNVIIWTNNLSFNLQYIDGSNYYYQLFEGTTGNFYYFQLTWSYSNNTFTTAGIKNINYQQKLISSTNIKTINNLSLLGSGNITPAQLGVSVTSTVITNLTDIL